MTTLSPIKRQNISPADINKAELKELITKFATATVMVVGDLILDEYLLAKPERISREAPVLILDYIKSDYALGGAANAAANLAALGAKVQMIGLTGEDEAASTLEGIARDLNIDLTAIKAPGRKTTLKTRVISSSSSNPDTGTVLKQQVLRIDKQSKNNIDANFEEQLLKQIENQITDTDIILLSDYNNGVLSQSSSERIIELANKYNKRVIVDSTGDFSKFKSAYAIAPNQPDTEKMLERNISNEEELEQACLDLQNKIQSQQILITRGAKGMALFYEGQLDLIPAFNLSEVFDVTGAGDTVAACFTLAQALGSSPRSAALIGNLAASLVVRKYGTATTNPKELNKLIDEIS